MQWLELTSERFGDAVKESGGLCLLPLAVIERHGSHLPVGTDQITADTVVKQAAEEEPAVVFPSYYFGKIFTAKQFPGTLALTRKLLLPLLEATIEEIARNGFRKILIANGHGGNRSMLDFFLRTLLEEPRGYVVYATHYYDLEGEALERWRQMRDSDFGGHADEGETSAMLHMRPDLVRMEAMTEPEDGRSRGRTDHLAGLNTSVMWYADHPTHYAGDARTATAEKGRFLFRAFVDKVVKQMRAIKADGITPAVQQEFYRQTQHPHGEE
ncbi:MAG: creatininase family protein [Candidatus Brocadiae bacterium]|nr:creatininase family protein [Candidatus Brocadiia bacterium]